MLRFNGLPCPRPAASFEHPARAALRARSPGRAQGFPEIAHLPCYRANVNRRLTAPASLARISTRPRRGLDASRNRAIPVREARRRC